jgi:N-acetyl-gamma-glutamyl-phosphate reductase
VSHLVEPGTVVVDAASGTSGAGRGLRDDLHLANLHGDLTAYGTPRHRHTPEMERWLLALGGTDPGPVTFTPHLVPISRGLLATCSARLAAEAGQSDVTGALHDAYADEPFVTVLDGAGFPHTKAVHGSNGCQVAARVDPRTGRVVVITAIDNLGKGAAGQAVQNANLLLGLDEQLGLTAIGVYP